MTLDDKKLRQKIIQRNYRKVLNHGRKVNHNNKGEILIVSIILFLYVLYNVVTGPGL